jgi:hypothetical protein
LDIENLQLGYIVYNNFDHALWPSALTSVDAGSTATSGVYYDTTANLSTSTLPTGNDHVIIMAPGSTATLAGRAAIFTRPMGPVKPGGSYVIFEASVATVNAGAVQAAFIGLTTSTGLSTGNILKTVSGTANSNQLLPSTGAIGFWMHGDTPNNFDAIYQGVASNGAYSTITPPNSTAYASTVNCVVSTVLTNSTAYGGNPGNVYQSPASAPGVLTSTSCVKLGLLYNVPYNQIIFAVNGAQVGAVTVPASLVPSTSLFDTLNSYGAIIVTGGVMGATLSTGLKVDFLSAAATQRTAP